MVNGMTLRPQLEAIKKRADITRELASRRLYRLSSDQLVWKASPKEWSIAQILNHLNLTHSKVIPNFEEALHTGTMAEHEREEVIHFSMVDRIFIRMVGPNPPFPSPVPSIFTPELTPDPDLAVSEFFEYHDEIVDLLVRSDDFRLREVNVVSPVNSRLKPNFIAYMDSLVGHEQYHWGQVEDVVARLGSGQPY